MLPNDGSNTEGGPTGAGEHQAETPAPTTPPATAAPNSTPAPAPVAAAAGMPPAVAPAQAPVAAVAGAAPAAGAGPADGGAPPAAGGAAAGAGGAGAAAPQAQPDWDKTIDDLTNKLAADQSDLEKAKKEKAIADARQKDLDAIATQRATTAVAINLAEGDFTRWAALIEANKAGEDARLKPKIHDVDTEVAAAQTEFDRLTTDVSQDEKDVAKETDALAAAQKAFADAQKSLSQLAARIKDSQGKVDKLRAEVRSAVEAKDWSRAAYKNRRLSEAVADAHTVSGVEGEQATILAVLDQDKVEVATALQNLTDAKQKLDDDRASLKVAAQELKDKQAGREAAIANFL